MWWNVAAATLLLLSLSSLFGFGAAVQGAAVDIGGEASGGDVNGLTSASDDATDETPALPTTTEFSKCIICCS